MKPAEEYPKVDEKGDYGKFIEFLGLGRKLSSSRLWVNLFAGDDDEGEEGSLANWLLLNTS